MMCPNCGHPLAVVHVGYAPHGRVEACAKCGALYYTHELNKLRQDG